MFFFFLGAGGKEGLVGKLYVPGQGGAGEGCLCTE